MRHGKTVNHLGRQASHRKALMKNMANALIQYKRITTTLAKAKALRGYLEPLITKTKNDSVHERRVVFSYLQNKEAIKELFGAIAAKVANRPGGYLRIFKIGFRQGDGAEMAIIEFVDFNETMLETKETGSKRTRRTRRSKKVSVTNNAAEGDNIATDAIVVDENSTNDVANEAEKA